MTGPNATDTPPAPPPATADAVGVVAGLAGPALEALAGLPFAAVGAVSGLLAPFGQVLGQFGHGAPQLPPSTGVPAAVTTRLAGLDTGAALLGAPAQAYQTDVAGQRSRTHAMDGLEHELRAVLEKSAANATMDRGRIDEVISHVTATLRGLGPIANTPMGRLAVLAALTRGLQQAGAVLTDAVGKDALNADAVAAMAASYLHDVDAEHAGGHRQPAVGDGPRSWAIAALAANNITDPVAVANWLPGLMTMGERESGHDPRACNDWDSNAANGTPSLGWMQTIRPTFDAHWRPGTSRDIFDPVANAAAAIHYVMRRYGVSADGSDLMAKVQQANPDAAPRGY